MPDIFDSLTTKPPSSGKRDIFDDLMAGEPTRQSEPGILDALREVPGQVGRYLLSGGPAAGFQPQFLAQQAEDRLKADQGDPEAKSRIEARGLIASSSVGAVVPGGAGILGRTALGALGGAIGGGLDAGARGEEIGPGAGSGALFGGALGLGFGAVSMAVQRLLKLGRPVPSELAESAAREIPAGPPSEAMRSPQARAVIQASRAGMRDRDTRLQVATGIIGRKITSFKELTDQESDEVMGYFRQLADDPPAGLERGAASVNANLAKALRTEPWRVGEALEDAALTFHRLGTAGSSFFRRLGPEGEMLAELAETSRANALGRIGLEAERIVKPLSKRFTEKEAELIGEIMEGAPTTDSRLRAAADQLSDLLKVYGDESEQIGLGVLNSKTGAINAFRAIPHYFPRLYTDESIKRFTPPSARQLMARQWRKLPPEIRGGNVQFAREANLPGYEKNAFKAVAMYIDRAAPRLEQAKLFGAKDQVAEDLMIQIGKNKGPLAERQAREVFKAWAYPQGRDRAPLADILRDLAAPLFLTYSGIVQPSQVLTNTVAREGLLNTAKGMARYIISRKARSVAAESGAGLRSAIDDMVTPRGFSNTWSHMIGLHQLDRANRFASALAAQYRAKDLAREVARGRLGPAVIRDAKRLGLDLERIASGGLSERDLRTAALRGSISTQFLADALSTPLAKQSGWGGVVYLYKNFLLNQGRFVKDLVVDARGGHWGPLARYLGSLGTVGVAYGEFMRSLRGKEPPDEMHWRVLEDMAAIGSAGVYADMLRAMGHSPEHVYSVLAGPVISEAVGTSVDVGKALTGETDPLHRRVLRRTVKRVPVIGEELYQELAP